MNHLQPNSDLAQLVEHGTDDQEVVGSNPTLVNSLFGPMDYLPLYQNFEVSV